MNSIEDSTAASLRRMIVGYRLSQALFVAARLGIADLLEGGPKTADELAKTTNTHTPSLYRVLRLLASEGVFKEQENRRFKLTHLGELLRDGVPDSLRSRAIFDGEECNWKAWGNLLHSVTTGESAFDYTFGMGAFEYFKRNEAVAASFDDLMASQTDAWARSVLKAYDFSKVKTLTDVGGGYGALISAILNEHPTMRGVLYDLPHVVEGAVTRLKAAGVEDRCKAVAGDFFQSVPKGGDAYIMKHVLHDWGDEECRLILENCRKAMPPDGKLLVVEILIAPGNAPDYGKYLDLNMLVLVRGRERTEAEYSKLFDASGFRLTGVFSSASELSVIEAVPIN